jgi:arsenate reductase
MKEKQSILFLCTGNSCRSQMAEGWTKFFHNNFFDVYSAGLEARGLDQNAVKVMREAGVDISRFKSKTVLELKGIEFEYVITLCSHADKNCTHFPAKTKVIHRGFDDPPKLSLNAKTEEEALFHYRRVRDEIKSFVENLHLFLK